MYSDQAIQNVCKLLGYDLRPWQLELIRHMLDNPKTIVQGCRQVTGKTFCITLVAVIFLLDKKSIALGMPNKRSAESILLKSIIDEIRKLEKHGLIKMIKDRADQKEFSNGAQLWAFTADKSSVKEGHRDIYLVILDEGQKMLDPEIMAIFEPFLTTAEMKGEDRFVITGIGGPKDSLIVSARELENKDEQKVFKRKTFPASYINTFTDEYVDFFERKRASLGQLLYDVHYECSDLEAGQHYLFENIAERVPMDANYTSNHVFGIDVGGTSENADFTCCIAIECNNGIYNIVDVVRMRNVKAMKEAEALTKFVNKYRRNRGGVAIEVNGIGHKLKDLLYEDCGIHDIGSVTMNYNKKFDLTNVAERLVRTGKLGCCCPEVTKELLSMTIQVDNKGKYVWKHSDIFSALLIALTRIGEVERII
jgi:hypothetical protein